MTRELVIAAQEVIKEMDVLEGDIAALREMVLSEQDAVHLTVGQAPHFYQVDLHGVTALKLLWRLREDAEERLQGLREHLRAL